MATARVKEILSWYAGENPGVLSNLARIMNTGKLAGTGRFVILPVDQGFEHGPARSFAGSVAIACCTDAASCFCANDSSCEPDAGMRSSTTGSPASASLRRLRDRSTHALTTIR